MIGTEFVSWNRRLGLIPRNNWDYGFAELARSLAGIFCVEEGLRSGIDEILGSNAVMTSSGRSSLYAILRALNLPSGSGVGVPLFCCPVVFDAIIRAGCKPIFLDCNENDYTLDPDEIRGKRDGLAALVAVHLFGRPCDMDAINKAAKDIPIIEDCAHALTSTFRGKRVGYLATASFFTFRSGKFISAGEGSAILCRSQQLTDAVREVVNTFEPWSRRSMIRDSLMTWLKSTFYHRPLFGMIGYPVGMKLDKKLNLTSKDGFHLRRIAPSYLAVVNHRLPAFHSCLGRQNSYFRTLRECLREAPEIVLPPLDSDKHTGNAFQFPVRLSSQEQRDRMAKFMFKNGIDCAPYLDDIVDTAREHFGYAGDCPVAERCSKTMLLLPAYCTLTQRDILRVAQTFIRGLKAMT